MTDAVTSFLDAMRAEGVEPADPAAIVPTSTLKRFQVSDERRGRESGYYVLHVDEHPAGLFGDFRKHGTEGVKWKLTSSNPGRQLSEAERREYAERIRAKERDRQAEVERVHMECSFQSAKIWREAAPASPDHPYLVKKHVWPHIARECAGDQLLIPVTRGGQLVGLQYIYADGTKRFKFGTPIRGSYATLGKPDDVRLVICEGFSTGATIHEATGLPVVIAFNAGNLESVAVAIREKNPNAEIIIAADDDRWGRPGENAGIAGAERAAGAIRGLLRRPIFTGENTSGATDFNDLGWLEGSDQVRRQILEPPTAPTPAPVVSEINPLVLQAPFPHMNTNGRPLATIENLRELLERLSVTVRYNVISKDREILIPNAGYSIDNLKNASVAKILSFCKLAKLPTDNVTDYLTEIGDTNQYNPVTTWILSKPWDGVSRLPEFYKTITAAGENRDPGIQGMKETLLKRWLISACAAAFSPNGVSAHGVLVFQGRQYLGKTAWFKRLAPADLGVTADGQMLKPDDRDSVKQVVSKWLVELGELDATFRKADVAQLKAFLTKDRDTLRLPYAREESQFARRTVFFASVNETEFLADRTGNRRFWVIECDEIDHKHTVDMQQLWAEVYKLYASGETWYLLEHEMANLNEANQNFEVRDPITERLSKWFNWNAPDIAWTWKTATEILNETGMDRPTQGDLNRVAPAIKTIHGSVQANRTKTGKKLWCPPVSPRYS